MLCFDPLWIKTDFFLRILVSVTAHCLPNRYRQHLLSFWQQVSFWKDLEAFVVHPEVPCCECGRDVPSLDHISSVTPTLYSIGWSWAQQKVVTYSAYCCLFCTCCGWEALWPSAEELIVEELKLRSSWSSAREQDDLPINPDYQGLMLV